MLLKEEVELVDVDMCDFGMTASDEHGGALFSPQAHESAHQFC